MSYLIQEYQHEDVEEMIALGAHMHREGRYKFLPYLPDKLRQLDQMVYDHKRTLVNGWVAKYEGRIIGMYVAYITNFFFCDVKMGSDYFLYVDVKHRKKFPMMAVRLIKLAEKWAKQMGAVEFQPGNSAMIEPRVGQIYKFLKYDIVGEIYKKDLK